MTDAASRLIHSARLITGGLATDDAWVRSEAGVVTDVGTGTNWPGADIVIDARAEAGPDAILAPGFIDIHAHGGAGASYDEGIEAIRAARALHLAHGTTRSVISLVTAPLAELERRLGEIAELTRRDAGVLGAHLEGPFLDPAHHGAHEPSLLTAPDPAAIARLLDAGAGTVRQVTIAPELPGGLQAIEQIAASGAAVAVGHTGADGEIAAAAFAAGATILTHAFNAMPGIHHRSPGPVLAAVADERVTIEAIADGVHLHPQIVRLLFDAAPGRVALITDAMAAAGAGDGDYDLGAVAVRVAGGIAHAKSTGAIAGSTLTQDRALHLAVAAGVPLADALLALTATPARAIGRGRDLGQLAAGFAADAVLLDAGLAVRRVWPAGG